MLKRYLQDYILSDLKEKMVFIGGPRQVGKTTLTRIIADSFYPLNNAYMNWDDRNDRKRILSGQFPLATGLIVFDEIHKYREWKSFVKGMYDTNSKNYQILVTGSSRLDIFKKGGDSLLGRYHYYRLHPLSYGEVLGIKDVVEPFKELSFVDDSKLDGESFKRLYRFGGFPEMYLRADERELRRWHNERVDRLIKEDIRDVEIIRDLSSVQILSELLKDKVGSLFSLNSLTEDLRVTHKTVAYWVDVLERFYYHVRVYPFQSTRIRSLRKEPKLYLWDWSEVDDEGARLENFVALHLLKMCHFLHDWHGHKLELYYLRDKDQREVDFLVAVGGKPWMSVEVKNQFKNIPTSVFYFKERLRIPYNYVLTNTNDSFVQDGIRVMSCQKFLSGMV
jgi:uncharacterized protein